MLGQGNNLVELIDAPSGKHFASQADERGEGSRSEASPDDKAPNRIGDVNDPVSDFDIWRTLNQNSRVQILTCHSVPLRLATTERGHRGLSFVNESGISA